MNRERERERKREREKERAVLNRIVLVKNLYNTCPDLVKPKLKRVYNAIIINTSQAGQVPDAKSGHVLTVSP